MKRSIRAIPVLLALILLFSPLPALSQEAPGRGAPGQDAGFRLEQNYPNPFNPETRIPFVLSEESIVDGRPAVVTLRVYNVLLQHVATPTALAHPSGDGVPVQDLEYPHAGRQEAYWDGRDVQGNEVASGIYVLQLVVNGREAIRKMYVAK
jgi:hypothetical protein